MITIYVPMSARDALLLPRGSGEGHRGVWFYDPAVYAVSLGDEVSFVSGGAEVARGTVTKMGTEEMPDGDFKVYCSRVNGKVFEWEG